MKIQQVDCHANVVLIHWSSYSTHKQVPWGIVSYGRWNKLETILALSAAVNTHASNSAIPVPDLFFPLQIYSWRVET